MSTVLMAYSVIIVYIFTFSWLYSSQGLKAITTAQLRLLVRIVLVIKVVDYFSKTFQSQKHELFAKRDSVILGNLYTSNKLLN